jgi:hypothetical protein
MLQYLGGEEVRSPYINQAEGVEWSGVEWSGVEWEVKSYFSVTAVNKHKFTSTF